MVDFGIEFHFWWFEWIVGRKANVEEENAAFIGRVAGSHESGLPVEEIIPHWASAAVARRILRIVLELLLDTFLCHLAAVCVCACACACVRVRVRVRVCVGVCVSAFASA